MIRGPFLKWPHKIDPESHFHFHFKKCKSMTIKEAWPEFKYLHPMQARLDEKGHSVEDFICRIEKESSYGQFPVEIKSMGQEALIAFIGAFGWAYITKLIVELYPK